MAMIPNRKMKFKLNVVVLGLIVCGFLVLIGRIIYISCFAEIDGVKYGAKAYNQQLCVDNIAANRGAIYDRNMIPLAQSATVWTVSLAPNQIKKGDEEKISRFLSETLGVEYEKILKKCESKTKYEIVKKKVEKPDVDKILDFIHSNHILGIHMVEDTKRYYPMSNMAAQTIGFVGGDNQGLLGVELSYNKELSGVAGKVTGVQNAKGGPMPYDYESYYPSQDGNSLVLSLDSTLQHYCDKALDEVMKVRKPANRCMAIMTNVNTGEILALSIKPDFNLNDPFVIPPIDQFPKIEGKSEADARTAVWTNKAVSETYEPGSVFKVVTGSAALEEGTMTLDSKFHCNGSCVVDDRKFGCWRTSGHGSENFTQAFINSCNPAFIKIGASLGPNLFFRYFSMYGMTEKTKIDLPGETDSMYVKEKDFTPVSLASESFGQTEAITAVQMISAFNAVVNGGYLHTPHVVNQVLDSNGNVLQTIGPQTKRQVISETTSNTMRGVLEGVVKGIDGKGTNASIPGYRIIGKSGTAQNLKHLQQTGQKIYVSSFVGAIPAEKPQYSLMVLIDTPTDGTYYGGTIASPVFAKIMREAAPYLGIAPEYTQDELEHISAVVPACEGMSVDEARGKLQRSGFKNVEIVGSGGNVLNQTPKTGNNISRSNKVVLYTENFDDKTIGVPNLLGLSQAEANSVLAGCGLNLSVENSGVQSQKARAVSQSPSPGESVLRGAVVSVEFLTDDETG